jgi:SAM-dependent methyltransferase
MHDYRKQNFNASEARPPDIQAVQQISPATAISLIKTTIKRILSPIFKLTATRSKGLSQELQYWNNWLCNHGGIDATGYQKRIDPTLALSDYHGEIVDRLRRDTVRILDVGAGPLTVVGKCWKDCHIDLVAVDPLADEYDILLEQNHLVPPVRTKKCLGENLSTEFGHETFDLVTAINSIDHSEDPVRIVDEMYRVCKLGGFLVLSHVENEAKKEGYRGLHQWNLSLQDNNFVIEGKGITTSIDDLYRGKLEMVNHRDGEWIQIIAKKIVV